jgi:hypothetical protein
VRNIEGSPESKRPESLHGTANDSSCQHGAFALARLVRLLGRQAARQALNSSGVSQKPSLASLSHDEAVSPRPTPTTEAADA